MTNLNTPNNEKQESAESVGDMPRGKFQQELAQYKTPAARLKFLRGLAAQIDALNISWTEAHADEMQRISRQRLNYVDLSAEDIKRVSAAEPAFLRHQYLTLWPWSVGYVNDGYNTPIVYFDDYTPSIEVLRAFRADFAHVLDDRGAQSSLFGGGLTEEQREAWPNYYDIHPDLRRLYLLFAAVYITDFARHVRKLIDVAAGERAARKTSPPDTSGRTYRTKAAAERAQELADWYDVTRIDSLALPVMSGIECAMHGLHVPDTPAPYLLSAGQDVKNIGELMLKQGRFYLAGRDKRAAQEKDLIDLINDGKVAAEDTVLMAGIYTLCWEWRNSQQEVKKGVDGVITPVRDSREIAIYMPAFLQYVGAAPKDKSETGRRGGKIYRAGISQDKIDAAIKKLSRLNSLFGVIPKMGIYAAFILKYYDEKTNTAIIEIPYCDALIDYAAEERARRKTEIETKIKGNKATRGRAKPRKPRKPREIAIPPENSYLIDRRILSAKNKLAAVNVMNIVRLIETAGMDGEPHIRWRNLIDKNSELSDAVESGTNPWQLLKRTFQTTWKYLEVYAPKLREKYPTLKIVFTGGKDYPTPTTLDEVVKFPHPQEKPEKQAPVKKKQTRAQQSDTDGDADLRTK